MRSWSRSSVGWRRSTRASCCQPSIVGFNDGLKPYAYDPDAAKQLLEDAGVAGQTHHPRGHIGSLAEGPRARGGRRRLSGRPPGSRSTCRSWSSAPTSTSCSTARPGPTPSSCRARTTCSMPTGSYRPTTKPVAWARRTPTRRCPTSSTQGRQTTDQDERAGIYNQAVKRAYDNAYFVWLVNNEDIYGMSDRLSWQPRVDAKLLSPRCRSAEPGGTGPGASDRSRTTDRGRPTWVGS